MRRIGLAIMGVGAVALAQAAVAQHPSDATMRSGTPPAYSGSGPAATTRAVAPTPAAASTQAVPTPGFSRISARHLIGVPVESSSTERVGQITDVLMTSVGAVESVIIDMDQFGDRDVVMPWQSLVWVRFNDDSVRVRVPYTREQLQALPAYQVGR